MCQQQDSPTSAFNMQEAEAEQASGADAAVTVNASEVALPAAKAEAVEKPASKAPARSTRVAAPSAKIRLGSKCVASSLSA